MYAFSYEVPGTESMYHRVKSALGDAPEGQILHLVNRTENGLRHLSVWRSREEWESYRDGTVRPAVNAFLAQMGIPEPPLPQEEELPLVDLVTTG